MGPASKEPGFRLLCKGCTAAELESEDRRQVRKCPEIQQRWGTNLDCSGHVGMVKNDLIRGMLWKQS